jgi:HK97 family phage prohead protease
VLQFDIDVTAADADARTIEGIAVPYDETANLGGTEYAFGPGSLKPARDRTPLLLGHDRNRPVGILTELADTDQGAVARFRVDNGPEGDLALEQAVSGSRGGLSIGAEIVNGTEDERGVIHVAEAALLEISLVAIPAFAGSAVTSVTAEATEDDEDLTTPDDDPEPDPTTNHQPDHQETPVETTPEPIAAAAPIPTISLEKRTPMAADTFIVNTVRAMKGDHNAMRLVEAELDVIDSAAIIGLVPDAYLRQIIGGLAENRPLANNVRNAALPAEGMKLYKPTWTTTPVGGWIAEDDATPSNAIAIGNHEVSIQQWAYGVSMTVASLERGFGVAESVFRQIILSYYAAVEANERRRGGRRRRHHPRHDRQLQRRGLQGLGPPPRQGVHGARRLGRPARHGRQPAVHGRLDERQHDRGPGRRPRHRRHVEPRRRHPRRRRL